MRKTRPFDWTGLGLKIEGCKSSSCVSGLHFRILKVGRSLMNVVDIRLVKWVPPA